MKIFKHLAFRSILLLVFLVLSFLIFGTVQFETPYPKVAALVVWIVFLVYENLKFKSTEEGVLKKVNVKLIGISFLAIAFLFLFSPYHKFSQNSPDGNYKLSVYVFPGFFRVTMPGDGGSLGSCVVLFDKDGRKRDENREGPFINDINPKFFDWDMAEGYVRYHQGSDFLYFDQSDKQE